VYDGAGATRTERRGAPAYIARPAGQSSARAAKRIEVARHAVNELTRWFGKSPLLPVTEIVEVASELGGMEHSHAIHVARGTGEKDMHDVIAHEVTHQWFGNAVRHATFADTWLSEGLTEYLTVRLAELRDGTRAGKAQLDGHLDEAELALVARRASRARLPLRPAFDHVAAGQVVDNYLYYFGTFVFAALERQLGRARFDKVLAQWFAAKKGTAVRTDDFFAFLKAKTGTDFAAFRAKWIDELPEPAELKLAAQALREGRAPA
jgi:aminopeptidase N